MKIVADENIPLLHECFGALGEVVALSGRDLTPDDLVDTDALVIRSVTRVNDALLSKASSLKFVGSCTAGIDHVDQALLRDRGIEFANAPGCNARSVVEYVLCALDILGERDGYRLEDRTVGIIGKGQVGGRLYQVLIDLGVRVLVNDPLSEQVAGVPFVSRDELIARCDVIALHTPLTRDCEHPTWHLIGETQLRAMKPGTVLISAGRGAVVDNDALLKVLEEGQDLKVVLDVWEHEPQVDSELLRRVDIGTPHIAGYSLDAKITGTEMVYKALCHTFGLPTRVRLGAIAPIPALKRMGFTGEANEDQVARLAMRAVYDIRKDESLMRQLLILSEREQILRFDAMRKNYAERREFSTLKLQLRKCEESVRTKAAALGFNLQD